MSADRIRRSVERWCRVRRHMVEEVDVQIVEARPRAGTTLSVVKSGPSFWCAFVDHGPNFYVLIVASYLEAWAVGADLCRALERRLADGRVVHDGA